MALNSRFRWLVPVSLSLVGAIGLLAFVSVVAQSVNSPYGIAHFAFLPPDPRDGPFWLYPLAALVPLALAVRFRSLTRLLFTQLGFHAAGVFHAVWLYRSTEGIGVLFVWAFIGAVAHALVWVNYLSLVAAGILRWQSTDE